MPSVMKEYLNSDNSGTDLSPRLDRHWRTVFADQRRNISRIFASHKPGAVACLGAGRLNDIPYTQFIESGAQVYLVDWLKGLIDTGLTLSIIDHDKAHHPQCLYCCPSVEHPEEFCTNYQCPVGGGAGVCDRYEPSAANPSVCSKYERSTRPVVCEGEDVTDGFATAFGHEVAGRLRGVRTWKHAFRLASDAATSARRYYALVQIPDASIDFVTSSMVVSQFEQEPYHFFAYCAAEHLGQPSAEDERRLLPAMESLRSKIFEIQVERHCALIRRIMTKDAVCYISFELFRRHESGRQWYLVHGMTRALEIIGQYFNFDYDFLHESESITRFQTRDDPSLAHSFVLTPKPDEK